MPDAWDYTDALVFESVGDAVSNGAGLSRMIAFIDYVDRTVLNHAEMERTLQRLLGSRLIEDTAAANYRLRGEHFATALNEYHEDMRKRIERKK